MSCTVAQVLELVDRMAPFECAEPWDNVGLLAGKPEAVVDRVLCALDLRREVIQEAVNRHCQLVVTHHPILFRGRKNLCETDAEGRMLCDLIRSNLSMIAAHTNFDNASPGVNDALAEAVGLKEVRALESGMRVGKVQERDFGAFCGAVQRALGGPTRCYGAMTRPVRCVAVLGGAGEDYVSVAREAGADVYLTGEIAYHKALDAVDNGMGIIEAGHAATEHPAISLLCRGLQKASDALQYDIRVLQSEVKVYC